MVKEINTADFKAALAEGKVIVADFWAVWCGPCRMLSPVLDELSEEFAGKAEFVKINVDEELVLSQEYDIMSIPCVIVFKNGEVAAKNVGFLSKSAMKEFIEKNI